MNRDILDLRNLIEGFKLSCQTEGKSPQTVEWYMSFLYRFLHFLETNKLPVEPGRINKNHIREFIRFLQTEVKTPYRNKPLSAATIQGYVRTLKAFFSWLTREEYIETNPMLMIPVPKAPYKVVNTFSHEQISKLTDLCFRSNGYNYRNLAILLLLLDTGIRVSELIGINIDDVDLAEGYIRIRKGKGSKERTAPIGSVVQKTLWKYINRYRIRPITRRINGLFLSDKGLPLTRSGVQQVLRRYCRQAGIKGVRCSPHTCRHTFAKNYLLNGGDVFSLQRILGHSSLASSRIYLNLFATDIKKQHRRYSPIDNMVENRGMHALTR